MSMTIEREIQVVQIAGWPRSGTNYLQWLLRYNFWNLIVIPGYKHYSPTATDMAVLEGGADEIAMGRRMIRLGRKASPDDAEVQVTTCWRLAIPTEGMSGCNPVQATPEVLDCIKVAAWAREVRYALIVKHPVGAYVSFVRAWPAKRLSERLMPGWSSFHRDWLNLIARLDKRAACLDFCEAVAEPERAVDQLARDLSMRGSHNVRADVPRGYLTRSCEESSTRFDRQYWLQHRYWDDVSEQELNYLKASVPDKLMEDLGYTWERGT